MATETDKTNNGVIGTIVVVGVFAMIAVSAAVTALVRTEVGAAKEAEGTNADLRTVRELKSAQRADLAAAPHWVDKAKGVVAIPIDQAMDLVVRDISKNPELATAAPPAGQAGAAGSDPQEGKSAKSKEPDETAKKGTSSGAKPGVAPEGRAL